MKEIEVRIRKPPEDQLAWRNIKGQSPPTQQVSNEQASENSRPLKLPCLSSKWGLGFREEHPTSQGGAWGVGARTAAAVAGMAGRWPGRWGWWLGWRGGGRAGMVTAVGEGTGQWVVTDPVASTILATTPAVPVTAITATAPPFTPPAPASPATPPAVLATNWPPNPKPIPHPPWRGVAPYSGLSHWMGSHPIPPCPIPQPPGACTAPSGRELPHKVMDFPDGEIRRFGA